MTTKRFEPAATASSARELFKNDAAPALLPMLLPLAMAEARHRSTARATISAAAVFADRRRASSSRAARTAAGVSRGSRNRPKTTRTARIHDLEVVRASAADYERAAARAGK